MAILQALISLITRSAGKVLNAIFGWAVLALFGQTSPTEQTLLSGVVGAAAAWPLLFIGVIFPKAALFVIAFVPLAKTVPGGILRLVWVALALLVPIVVGIVIASRSPDSHLPEPKWKKLLRGFPVTLALAAAFLLMLVIAPGLKIVNALKGKKDLHIAVLVKKHHSQELMQALLSVLAVHGIALSPAEPTWYMTWPSKVLRKLGGNAFAGYVPDRIEYVKNEKLEITVNPNELLLRGKSAEIAKAHGLAAEVLAPRDVLQTFDAKAQDLERQIKRVWSVYDERPGDHLRSHALLERLDEISVELSESNLPYDEFQIVYREALQLDRALRGRHPLLAKPPADVEADMASQKQLTTGASVQRHEDALPDRVPIAVDGMSNRQLVGHISQTAVLLAKKEIELAKTELRADLKAEVAMAKGLGVAGLCALLTVVMMLVAAALALGNVMPEWAAALVVAGGVLLVGTVAGVIGWGKRVKNPLEATRRTLKEDAQWAKERIA